MDVDHGQRQRPPADLAPRGLAHPAVVDDAHVARRAAHVEAQQVAVAGLGGQQRGRRGAARRPAEDRERCMARGEVERRQAAAGLHDRGLWEVGLARRLRERAQVAAQQRRQRGVDLGGGGALVLAERADDLVR